MSSTGQANRSASSSYASSSQCAVTSSTTQFALRMQDGRVVAFDQVGNMRTQEALKNKKNWSSAMQSGKDIKVTANGVLSGDKLTVMSID
jgi:hypothetical protein